ncbi:hypothetical protein [Sphingomonas sp.]|uniref:hypothetical protein n=1 Tax=Sphingomonas sp. TaxID=28214 RepID=UPI002ED8109D
MKNILSIREAVVLLMAAFIPGVVLGLIGVVAGNPREAIWAFPLALAFALAIAFAVGLPSVILLNAIKAYSLPWYLLVGFLASAVLACYFILPNMMKTDWTLGWPSYAAQFVVLLALSTAASTFYWLVARPDKIHAL